jgi:anti-sigma factor RsiW
MVDIIRLNGDPHTQAQRLLPWYVNGALEGEELAQVEAHLTDCAECREDLKTEQSLAHEIRTLPASAGRLAARC